MNRNDQIKQEKISFALFFDEYKGLSHLEALEIISRQTSVKLEMINLNKKKTSQLESYAHTV
jgi:hypothetical protein